MKYVLFVNFATPAEVLIPKTPTEVREHLRRLQEFGAQGTLLMAGAFHTPGEPLSTMGIFATRQAAEALVAGSGARSLCSC